MSLEHSSYKPIESLRELDQRKNISKKGMANISVKWIGITSALLDDNKKKIWYGTMKEGALTSIQQAAKTPLETWKWHFADDMKSIE